MTARMTWGTALVWLFIIAATPVNALVNHDEGRLEVGGIQLLQNANNPKEYYYLPPAPYISSKLVLNEAGEEEEIFDFLFMQYVGGPDGASSGGIIHALIEFNLPQESVEELEILLQNERPGAIIIGQVPLLPVVSEGADGNGSNMGSFEIKSATLSGNGASLNDKVVTSGVAPVMPGSKAVMAAKLDQTEAVLLSASFEGPTSDLSIAIHAYYQAKVSAFNARVSADMETVYTHKSLLNNQQGGFTRRQLRKIVDELHQDGSIKVEVFDQSQGLGVDTGEVEKILNVVTNKLTEVMFDSSTGWSAVPEYETAVEKGQISGRQKRGFMGKLFKGSGNKKYKSDNQYTVKRREDIRQQHFEMILNKETTIKVPFDTAGNLGGLYALLGQDERYFRVVNMADDVRPTTLQQVNFQIDGNYVDAFKDQINFVSVRLRKTYPDGSAQSNDLLFSHDKVSEGETMQSISFPRGGDKSANWRDFDYQVRWSIRGQETITQPEQEGEWHHSSDSTVSLNPPFQKRVIKAEVDRELLRKNDIANVVVLFGATLFGDPVASDSVVLRKSDGEAVQQIVLFHDAGTPIVKRAVWNTNDGEIREKVEIVDGDYLYLIPPPKGGEVN
jgi:hypothetical protein